jgi:hypothetical protein
MITKANEGVGLVGETIKKGSKKLENWKGGQEKVVVSEKRERK